MMTFALSYALFPSADRTIEELDIREATFRYLFITNADWVKDDGTYCLGIGTRGREKNPDDAFMERFYGNKPAVRKASACNQSNLGVTDKTTGKHGVILRTEAIKWISEADVEIDGGDFVAGNGGSGNTYYLRKIDGKWTVQRVVRHWIS